MTSPTKQSARASSVNPFMVMKVAAAAAAQQSANPSRRIIHFEIGQPSTNPPQAISQSAITVLSDGTPHAYTSARGIPSLRTAISNLYHTRYALSVPSDDIIVTNGSSGAFVAAFVACFDVGDRVAIPVPGYPCYRNVLLALGVSVVEIPVHADGDWKMAVSALKKIERLKGVVVASPGNPTGCLYLKEDLKEIAAFCDEMNVTFISDEIYHGISQVDLPCALQLSDKAIVINSLSKYWCMTGYRIGWVVSRNPVIMNAMDRIVQNMSICSAVVSQYAAIAALSSEHAELDGHVDRYLRNMDGLLKDLRRAGFVLSKPEAAFYLYADCEAVCEFVGCTDSVELCEVLLKEADVAATPGVDFDRERGGSFVRFCCAGSEEEVREGGKRIVEWVEGKRVNVIRS